MFRIGVCDDEAYSREDLEKQLTAYFKSHEQKVEICLFEKGGDFLKDAGEKHFNLVFLDIEMEGPDAGMTAAESLQAISPDTLIVFVTSHSEYVYRSYRIKTFQYLTKPINQKLLIEEIDRAVNCIKEQNSRYEIGWNGKKYFIPIKEICYVETDKGHNVVIHTLKGNYITKRRLNYVEDDLKPYGFLRIHRSVLINMAFICGKRNKEICIQKKPEEIWLSISRDRQKTVDAAYISWRRKSSV